MPNFCRQLTTDLQVEYFVDGVLGITDQCEKRLAINYITAAERNIKDYSRYPTLTHEDNRDFQYRDDAARYKLRNQVIEELYEIRRLQKDDDIKLGEGGAAPWTEIQTGGKAFYIIGPPAAGKSGIAAKIADAVGGFLLDSDFAKRKLPEYTNQIGSASLVHEESDELIFGNNGLMELCIKKQQNIVIPKIGHNLQSIVDFCRGLKEANYKVFLISVDLDRQKATQRAFNRYVVTNRYVPLSLVFDGYGDQPTLNYFKIKQQQYENIFSGYAQISTDVSIDDPPRLVDLHDVKELNNIIWR